jgi:hypothetical protein
VPVSRNKVQRLYLRVSAGGFSFAVYHPFGGRPPVVENYEANLTASLNVNLREALAVTPLAQEKYNNTEVLLNVPYTLVPIERFDEDNVEDIYRLNFHETGNDRIFYDVAGALGVVFVYGQDEAFCRVVDENFPVVHFRAAISAVANRFAEKAHASRKPQLFAYRHEDTTDIFAFNDGRLQLGNRYVTHSVDDAAYFVMFAVDVLGMDVNADEFHVIDTQGDSTDLATRLRSFVRNVSEMDKDGTFGRPEFENPSSRLPYDLTVYLMQPF